MKRGCISTSAPRIPCALTLPYFRIALKQQAAGSIPAASVTTEEVLR